MTTIAGATDMSQLHRWLSHTLRRTPKPLVRNRTSPNQRGLLARPWTHRSADSHKPSAWPRRATPHGTERAQEMTLGYNRAIVAAPPGPSPKRPAQEGNKNVPKHAKRGKDAGAKMATDYHYYYYFYYYSKSACGSRLSNNSVCGSRPSSNPAA